eukprot:m51a1_g10481 Adaptor protein complex 5 (AP-5), sigma subunit (118) ;mRNA; r:41765-42206
MPALTPVASPPAPGGFPVAWRHVPQLGFAASVVLDEGEAPALALNVLGAVCRAVVECLSVRASAVSGAAPWAVVASRPDDVLIILEHLMPAGHLLFSPFVAERKEIETALRTSEGFK